MTHTPMSAAHVTATRHLIGLTADQLGQELGINPRTVRGWEAGKYTPSESAAQALLGLRAEHDTERDLLLRQAKTGTVTIPNAPRPRGWYRALGARVLDRIPDAQITWAA